MTWITPPATSSIVDDATPAPLMGESIFPMQKPALSTRAADAAESLHDAFRDRAADGILCAADIAYLTPMVQLVMVKTQRTDLAQAAGLAAMRGGPEAKRAASLLRELETFRPLEAA